MESNFTQTVKHSLQQGEENHTRWVRCLAKSFTLRQTAGAKARGHPFYSLQQEGVNRNEMQPSRAGLQLCSFVLQLCHFPSITFPAKLPHKSRSKAFHGTAIEMDRFGFGSLLLFGRLSS